MVNRVVVYYETEISFLLFRILAVHHLSQMLFGNTYLIVVAPGFLYFSQTGYVDNCLRVGIFIIVYLLGFVRNEYIYADFSFRLITVGSKPSQIVQVVQRIHVIVVRRIERHTDVVRTEITVVV